MACFQAVGKYCRRIMAFAMLQMATICLRGRILSMPLLIPSGPGAFLACNERIMWAISVGEVCGNSGFRTVKLRDTLVTRL